MKIVPSVRFNRDLKRVSQRDKKVLLKLGKSLDLLLKNPHHPSLRKHKLQGTEDNWSISLDMSLRVILTIKEDAIHLLRIGTHEEVY